MKNAGSSIITTTSGVTYPGWPVKHTLKNTKLFDISAMTKNNSTGFNKIAEFLGRSCVFFCFSYIFLAPSTYT